MTTEKFANLGESTLASPYTSGGLSITVVSAALFPTTGVFRVALGNVSRTIFRVDSVAGAVFTGAAEAFDGNAIAGDTVKQVGSKAVAERFLQSPEVGEARSPSGLAAADFFGPLHKFVALDQSGWTWDNQSTKSVVQANGIVFLSGPATGAGTSVAMRYTTAPATPYMITVAMQLLPAGDDGVVASASLMFGGIGFRAVGGGLRILVIAADGGVYIYQYINSTTFDLILVGRLPGYNSGPVWLQIEDDGVEHFLRYSTDGINFSMVRQSIIAEFAYTDIGFVLSTEGALASFPIDGPFGVGAVSILSWIQT